MANFVKHGPCSACGSSDGNAIYDDGSTYCFACETATDGGEESHHVPEGLIKSLKFQALDKRKLTMKTCKAYGYGVAYYKGAWWQVAGYRKNGKIVAQHIRSASKDFKWLGNSKGVELFGQHLWQAGGKRLVITEGELDCLSIYQVMPKWPVVSIPSGVGSAVKAIKDNLEFVESFDQIVLAFDDDDPGREAIEKVVDIITPGKCLVMKYGGLKDANDMLKESMGSMIQQNIYQAERYRPDSILAGKDLWGIIQKKTPPGLMTPYPKLNEAFNGFRPKELYMFTAGSGIGKSTIAKEILWSFFEQGKKIGVLSLEEGVKRATEGFMSLYLNHPIHVSRPPIEDLKRAFDYLTHDDRYFIYDHWGSNQIDAILSKIKFMGTALGCEWILLDHISMIVGSGDELGGGNTERQLIDAFMTKLRTLIEHIGIGVLAIVHLKRPSGPGKSWNEGRQVALVDLRGSGSLEQLSDGVIALERDQQGDQKNISVVRILKNRPIGITGVADTLAYHTMTGRLQVATDADFQADNSNQQQQGFGNGPGPNDDF